MFSTSLSKKRLKAELIGHENRLRNSYLLCALGLFGVCGAHRFYNGKFKTGVLWFLTWGLFGVGQVADVFFISNMVDVYETRLRRKLGYGVGSIPLNAGQAGMVDDRSSGDSRTKDEKIVALIEAAQRHDGMLSVTQAVLETRIGFDEVEALLRELARSEYVEMTNDMNTGAIVYHFVEI